MKTFKWISIESYTSSMTIDELYRLLNTTQSRFEPHTNKYNIIKLLQQVDTYDIIPDNIYGDHLYIEDIARFIQISKRDNDITNIFVVIDDNQFTKYSLEITKTDIKNIGYTKENE